MDFPTVEVAAPFGSHPIVDRWFPTGSSFICNPPVTDTDIDFSILVKDLFEAGDYFHEAGWTVTVDDPEYVIEQNGELPFITARKGIFNLIIFADQGGYTAFGRATEVAKRLNVRDKADRVALFQAVCSDRRLSETFDFE